MKIPDKIIVKLVSKQQFESVWQYLQTLEEFSNAVKPSFDIHSTCIRISINGLKYTSRNVETATTVTGFYSECHNWPVISFEQFKTAYMDQIPKAQLGSMPDKVIVTGIAQCKLFNEIMNKEFGASYCFTGFQEARMNFIGKSCDKGDAGEFKGHNEYTFLTESEFLALYKPKDMKDPNKIVISDVTDCVAVNNIVKEMGIKPLNNYYPECVIHLQTKTWMWSSTNGYCKTDPYYDNHTFMTQGEFIAKYSAKQYPVADKDCYKTEPQEEVVDIISMMNSKPKKQTASELLMQFIDN